MRSAVERIHDINPHVQVDVFEEPLTSENALRILDSFGLHEGETVRWLPNARAGTAVFHFERSA